MKELEKMTRRELAEIIVNDQIKRGVIKKENKELQSKYDKRINDMLHKIEFTNATPNEAYKMYMKLQGFLRKRRAIKPTSGNIYVPRTETGNYIIDGKVTKLKRGDKNGNR